MSCLFNSLSYFTNQISSDQLRNLICDYLLSNPKLFDIVDAKNVTEWESGMCLNQYVSNMRNTTVWGGGIEIKAFCEIFNFFVIVHLNTGTEIEFSPNFPNEQTQSIKINYNGNHYEPIKH